MLVLLQAGPPLLPPRESEPEVGVRGRSKGAPLSCAWSAPSPDVHICSEAIHQAGAGWPHTANHVPRSDRNGFKSLLHSCESEQGKSPLLSLSFASHKMAARIYGAPGTQGQGTAYSIAPALSWVVC